MAKHMTKIANFENSRWQWRTAAILNFFLYIAFLYLSRKSSDFDETWCILMRILIMWTHVAPYLGYTFGPSYSQQLILFNVDTLLTGRSVM